METMHRGEAPSSKRGKRRLWVAALAVIGLLAGAPVASAHPLGNFTVNHLTYVEVSRDRVELFYVLDQAEIPTFREQQQGNPSRQEVLRRKLAHVQANLQLAVNGRAVALRARDGARLTFPPGEAGLKTTRVELPFVARVQRPRAVRVRDFTYDGLLGYVDIVPRAGQGTTTRTTLSRDDPTNGLRRYSGTALNDAPQQRVGRFRVEPGPGTLVAPGGAQRPAQAQGGGDDGFAGVFEDAAAGEGLFLVLLLAAFGWGALHALSPGHGKAMVAAYLVGTRGTARHAVGLGAVVTVTHTIGVFALGVVTLALSQYILAEDLYPWLNLAAGLLIVTVGIGVLRSRIRWGRARRAAHAGSDHPHDHGEHAHSHHHHTPEATWKGITGMGMSAGLIPCPSALVVLLAAISQHEVGLGLLLITVFSLGLALTLTGLGLGVVYARRFASRVTAGLSFSGRVTAALPAISTLLILALGLVLTAKAIPELG